MFLPLSLLFLGKYYFYTVQLQWTDDDRKVSMAVCVLILNLNWFLLAKCIHKGSVFSRVSITHRILNYYHLLLQSVYDEIIKGRDTRKSLVCAFAIVIFTSFCLALFSRRRNDIWILRNFPPSDPPTIRWGRVEDAWGLSLLSPFKEANFSTYPPYIPNWGTSGGGVALELNLLIILYTSFLFAFVGVY